MQSTTRCSNALLGQSAPQQSRYIQNCNMNGPVAGQQRHLIRKCRPQLAPFSASPEDRRARRLLRSAAAAPTRAEQNEDPALQLGTAKLPKDVDVTSFKGKLYQWANALTTNSNNLPLALPLRVDGIDGGFQMQMLRMRDQDNLPVSVANILVTVEEEASGNILYIRLTEAEGSDMVLPRQGGSAQAYLKALSTALIDVSKVVNSMPPAIKLAVVQSRN